MRSSCALRKGRGTGEKKVPELDPHEFRHLPFAVLQIEEKRLHQLEGVPKASTQSLHMLPVYKTLRQKQLVALTKDLQYLQRLLVVTVLHIEASSEVAYVQLGRHLT